MESSEFTAAAGYPFLEKVLSEAISFVPDEVDAAYVEPLFGDGKALTGALALLVRGSRLNIISVEFTGPHRDDEVETFMVSSVPLHDLVVEYRLERSGWSRDEDVREMSDRAFTGTLRLPTAAGRFGTEISLPIADPKGFGGRHTQRTRAFLEDLAGRLSKPST
ncbi:MAG: hypothetical protein M3N53_00050 [Actinomycetota bacterium]|nr:hypothetical protein [Actinomycetota bacterium]